MGFRMTQRGQQRLVRNSGLALLALALSGAALVLLAGPILRLAAERFGTRVLGVPVKVERVAIRPLAGRIKMSNFQIANPPGYSRDPILAARELSATVRLSSLRGTNAIVVSRVEVTGLKVSYEIVKGVPNVQVLQSRPGARTEKEAGSHAAPAVPARTVRHVVVEQFTCNPAEVTVRAGITGGNPVPLPLPAIHAANIGREPGGVTAAGAVRRMVLELVSHVGAVVTDFLSNYRPSPIDRP